MATNAITVRPAANQQVSRYEQREVIDTIKQTVCKGASDAQLKMFLEVCKSTGLDPFLKEIWFVAEKSTIMAGRDGYLRVANEHPMFDGIETRVQRDEKGIPIKAVCTVWRKDRNHPTICEAYYSEYKKTSAVWTQYPSAMISKVAEVLALKRSFSINGVITEEEIGNEPPMAGSREAQQAVLDRKLAEIQERKQAEAAQAECIDAELIEEQANSPLMSSEQFRVANKAAKLEAFATAKELIGAEQYYRILKVIGAEHANQIPTLSAAVKAYGEMLMTYADMQQAEAV